MAITKTLVVTLNQDKAKPREKFFIYRNDVGVDIHIELSNLTYQFDNKRNNFKYANAIFRTPKGLVFTVHYLEIINERVVFSFTEEIIKNMQTIGKYELQLQLFDNTLNRISLPIIVFEVKEPIGQSGVAITEAIVDYSYTGSCFVANEINLFSIENGYVKTVWETGDLITASRLNNMEDGISNNRTDIDLLKGLLIKEPTYIAPTLQLTSSLSNAELGSSVSFLLKGVFNKNDAGSVNSISIRDGNIELSDTYSYTVPRFTLTGDKTYNIKVSYNDGVIKENNFGIESPNGQIKAGSLTASTTIKAYRGYFAYCSDNGEKPTAESIRANVIKGLNATNGTTMSITTTPNTRMVCFAYPYSIRDCTKIRYENLNDDENKTAFTMMTLNIPDASGNNEIAYRVYYYIAPIEFGMNATFTLTI